MLQPTTSHFSIAKQPIEPQELFHRDKLEEYQNLRPDLNKESMLKEISKQYDELSEELKTIYKEKANQILEEFKSNQDPQTKIPEIELKHAAETLEEILEGAIKKKVKVEKESNNPFQEESFLFTKEPSSFDLSFTRESANKANLPEENAEIVSDEKISMLEKVKLENPFDERGEFEKPVEVKKEIPASKTHEALSRAGKKGAAKRWGKKYEEQEGETSSSQEPKPKNSKTKPGIDPDISEAFAKIGYLGGKARGGDDKRGSNIDFKTHDALSKAGKMGAAKRWGQHAHREEMKNPSQSHVLTRSQKSSQINGTTRENIFPENKEEV